MIVKTSAHSTRLKIILVILFIVLTTYLFINLASLYSIAELVKHKVKHKAQVIQELYLTKDDTDEEVVPTKYVTLRDFFNGNMQQFTPAPNIPDEEQAAEVQKLYPNIPIQYWYKVRGKVTKMRLNDSCNAKFPDMYALDIKNTFWQQIFMTNRTALQLYSAYYDRRKESEKVVRILALVNRTEGNFPGFYKTLYCQLWFDGENVPLLAPMNKTKYMWYDAWDIHQEGMFGPYLLGCSIPQSHIDKVPVVVSVVENACDEAKNMLRVINEVPAVKQEFAVCVKGLDFLQKDVSLRLVEWIEFIFLMGVDKIFFYKFELHPRVKKVLDYYIQKGRADVREITLSSENPFMHFVQHIFIEKHLDVQMLNEIIPYNDCFYRNVNKYEYISLLDIDEVIFPLKDLNWHDLIQRTKNYYKKDKVYNSFLAEHIYFMDILQQEERFSNIPPYLHMMQSVYRSNKFNPDREYGKTIFVSNNTIVLHNHWPLSANPGSVTQVFKRQDARLQHYRKSCHSDNCTEFTNDPVKDFSFWKFKEELLPRVEDALLEIGLYPNDRFL